MKWNRRRHKEVEGSQDSILGTLHDSTMKTGFQIFTDSNIIVKRYGPISACNNVWYLRFICGESDNVIDRSYVNCEFNVVTYEDMGYPESGPSIISELSLTNVSEPPEFSANEFKRLAIMQIDPESLISKLKAFIEKSVEWSKYELGVEIYDR